MNEVEKVDEYTQLVTDLAIQHGPGLLLAIATLLIGLWIINAISRGFGKQFERSGMEKTLRNFLNSLINVGLKALLLISVASMVGIETTSFIAVLGAAGLAIGLALQGSLANFAGGVLILIFHPYKVGDFVEAAGHSGVVKSIEIFSTVLTTGDNKTIIIPNGAVSNSAITNYSTQATRRVDIVFGIGYDDDIKKAKDVLSELIAADERILTDPEPMIVVSNLGDSTVDITTRFWVNSADYWGVFFDLTEKTKLAFDANGISIPYPQTDVHVRQAA
ncbi:MAG TPA: mechanosensitive ion channel protein MscS [Gammaproteobacteria bacterium]|nr:mechanosensitive ion channel protein MscS [Gammaproteobacteria bacterium]